MTKKTRRTSTKKARSRKSSTRSKRKSRITTPRGVLNLEHGLGALPSARSIAKTIKRAADAGTSARASSYQAAMAAIAHLIRYLDKQLVRLRAAQKELRALYHEALENEQDRRMRVISDERVAAKSTRKRARKVDVKAAIN